MRRKIVVIGAGLAGSLLCNELADRADVTLLEIGRQNTIDYPRVAFDHKKLAEVATFCHGGGGTTNLWHNGLIPLRRDDLSGGEFAEVMAEAHTYTDAAASALFFTKESYSRAYARLVAKLGGVAGRIGDFPDGIDCLLYPKKFRRLEVDRRVSACYRVAEIGFAAGAGRVRSVSWLVNGKARTIVPDAVIVAAGALGSPKIVEALLKAAGAPVNGLGTGFIDHPMGFVGKVRFRPEVAALVRQLSVYDAGAYVSRNGIRVKSDCGRYTCCAFLRPAMTMDNRLAVYKYKSLLGASRGTARLRNACSGRIFHPDIVAEIVSHLFGATIPSRIFNVLFIAEQKRGTNRVYYDGDNLRVDWTISSEELDIYRNILKKLKNLLENVADEVNLVTDITEDWLWSAAHHSCTVSLGSGPAALVDRDLRLKCLDNAFVCDGSVIQEHSYANTGLAIGQLALRLAGRVLHVGA